MRNAHTKNSLRASTTPKPTFRTSTRPVKVTNANRGAAKLAVQVDDEFVETLYVSVRSIAPGKFEGRILNEPWHPSRHGLKTGQCVRFTAKQIEAYHPGAAFHGVKFYL